MPRKKKDGEPQPAAEPKRVTPLEIQQVEFRVGMRGYDQGEVDVFLDRLTEEVARLYAENKRLREELDFVRTRPLDTGTAAEADAIIRAARDEAARVLSEARAEGGATGSGAPPSTADLGRFLGRERAFLQNLANLIQAHAEGVKDDVRRHRETTRPPTESPRPVPVVEPSPAADRPAPAVDEPTRAWTGPPVDEDGPEASASSGSSVIQIPEAGAGASTEVRASAMAEGVPAPEGEPDPSDWRSYFAGDPEHLRREQEDAEEEPRPAAVGTVPPLAPPTPPLPEDDPTDPGEDRSIRELFWGET